MRTEVLSRFIKIMAIATFAMFSFWMAWQFLSPGVPGDYYVRQGSNQLADSKFEEAMESFNMALAEQPDHRGALIGRAIVYLQSGRHEEAEAEFTYLIGYLNKNLESDDPTGWAVLAASFANRGILYDRTGRYKKALEDYIRALKVDEDSVDGPSWVDDMLLYSSNPSTVRERAVYLQKQLALPEGQRLMRKPEKDKEQRMYKP